MEDLCVRQCGLLERVATPRKINPINAGKHGQFVQLVGQGIKIFPGKRRIANDGQIEIGTRPGVAAGT